MVPSRSQQSWGWGGRACPCSSHPSTSLPTRLCSSWGFRRAAEQTGASQCVEGGWGRVCLREMQQKSSDPSATEGGGLGTCCPCTLPFALLWVLCAQQAPSSALMLPAYSMVNHCQPFQGSASANGGLLKSDRGMPFGNLRATK